MTLRLWRRLLLLLLRSRHCRVRATIDTALDHLVVLRLWLLLHLAPGGGRARICSRILRRGGLTTLDALTRHALNIDDLLCLIGRDLLLRGGAGGALD